MNLSVTTFNPKEFTPETLITLETYGPIAIGMTSSTNLSARPENYLHLMPL